MKEEPQEGTGYGWFCDWLTVSQDHDVELPVHGDAEVSSVNIDTGLCDWVIVKGKSHRGSYSSTLLVRCDGRRVSISGNPSRFSRPDNVFGLRDLASCFAIYNTVLEAVGLPLFDSRAVLSRVDVTCNHTTGGPKELLACMRYLAGQRHYRSAEVFPDFQGLRFGKQATYSRLKFYAKGPELKKRMKDNPEHLGPLVDWCNEHGILREEWTLGRKLLHEKGLTGAGTTMGQLIELVEHRRAIPRRLETSRVRLVEIADALVERDVVKRKSTAIRLQGYAFAWASGADLKADLAESTFYRIRKQLLAVGLDVAHPMDVARVTPTPDVVTLNPADPPEFYELPATA